MGRLLQVRDVPDEVVAELKARAAAEGSTLSSYVRAQLARVVERPTNAELVERLVREDRDGNPTVADIVAEIRKGPRLVIVIDSSALVQALIAGDVDPELLALIADESLHAPNLPDFEVANSLRGVALGGKLTHDRAQRGLRNYKDLAIERYAMTDLLDSVLNGLNTLIHARNLLATDSNLSRKSRGNTHTFAALLP